MARKRQPKQPNTPVTPPADVETTNERGLTDKQQAFVNEYFLCGFNQTEAYRRAGYRGTYKVLASNAWRLMENEKVSAEIQRRMSEYAMTANEALSRLANQARGDLSNLLNDQGEFDFKRARQRGQTAIIKKLKHRRSIRHTSDDEADVIEDEHFEIELYDAQAAQLAILKQWQLDHGKPTERLVLTSELSDDELEKIIASDK